MMKVFRALWRTSALATLAFSLSAQTPTGTILGRVQDSSAAMIPGAKILVREVSTNLERSVVSNDLGYYEIPLLPSGIYDIEAEKVGFQRFAQNGVKLDIGMRLEIDMALNTGNVRETVTVTGQSPLLQTTSSSTGQVVENKQVASLPSSNRNLFQIATITPGVVDFGAGVAPATSGSVGFGEWSATGGPTNTNEFMLDGATAIIGNMNAASIIPTQDAIQEFKVQTNGMPAEFGRTGGAVVNAVYKSGTNSLHGTLYDFAKNRALNANTWLSNRSGQPKTFSNVQIFGGTVGGPVEIPKVYDGRNRTFFFFNFEGYRDVLPAQVLTSVPTALQRSGDFSQTKTANGSQIVIYDPLTTAPVAGSAGQYARQPFAGNVIPAGRINPVASAIVGYYGAPNVAPANVNTNANNYLAIPTGHDTQNEWTLKFDHNLSAAKRLFGRYSQSSQGGGAANLFGANPPCNECLVKTNPAGSYSPRGGGSDLFVYPKNAVVGYTQSLSPTLLMDLRYSMNRQLLSRLPQSTGFDIASLGFPKQLAQSLYYAQFPAIGIQNYQGLGTASNGDLIRRGDLTHAFQGSVTKISGRHTIKAGGDYRLVRYSEVQVSNESTQFSFDQAWTQQNPFAVNANAGWGLASFLLGFPASGDLQVPTAPSLQFSYIAGYVQDDWRVTERLTFNIGFRYDLETPYTERYNRISYFDPGVSSGATKLVPGAIGGLAFPGVNGASRYRQNMNWLRPGPRIGMAYKVTNSLVVRAAYGIIYPPSLAQGYNAAVFGYQPWLGDTPFVASADGGLTPSTSLNNPFPNGLNQPPGSAAGSNALLGQSITTQLWNLPAPYTQQYNLGFQQQIRSWLLDVGYVGAHGVHQLVNAPMNQLLPSQYALGSALNQQVPNPFLGLVGIGSFANSTLSRGQLLKPYPQFTDIQNGDENVGSWLYNSLQVKGERRFANGIGILASFTWSKEVGDTTGSHYYAANSVQNQYDLAAERSLEVFNIPRRLTLAYLWELPFGKGHRFFNSAPSVVNSLVTGWQINGITTFQDGQPTIVSNSSNVVGFGAGSRPNNNGTSALLPSDQRTPSRWFNTSVFSLPPQYTFGNVGPTSPDLRGQGINNWNVSLVKRTPIRERANLEFRAEFYNFFNHPLWGNPGGSVGSPTFGVVSSKTGNRIGQLALKLTY